jgi:hypothetical protein
MRPTEGTVTVNALRPLRRIQALVAAKLGRCAMCMRRSFVASTIAICALGGAQVLWQGSLVWLAALVAALALTALWLAHVAAFTTRSLRSRDGLARKTARGAERGSAAVVTRKQALVSGVGLAVLVSLPGEAAAIQTVGRPCPQPSPCTCKVYEKEICSNGSYCYPFECKHIRCVNGGCARPCGYDPLGSKAPVRALDLYFQAYRDAVSRGGGRPRASLLKKAMSVSLKSNARGHFELQRMTHAALHLALGDAFDGSGLEAASSKCAVFGNIRTIRDTEASVAAVDATHRALGGVFLRGDLDAIDREFDSFWDSFPRYAFEFDPCGRYAIDDVKKYQAARVTAIGSALLACRS